LLIVDDLLFWLPWKGVRWVLGELEKIAAHEAQNEAPLLEALLANELALEEGRIAKADYAAREAELMARLREIRAAKLAAQAGAAPEPISGKASLEVDLDFEGYGGEARRDDRGG
jgi:hypothetical protein